MDRNDIKGAVGGNTLSSLHLGLTLDDLLAVSVDAKVIALSLLRLREPDKHSLVSFIHQFTPSSAVGMLVAATVEGGASELVKVLVGARPGQEQAERAEALALAYAVYVACYRLQEVADWSPNSFSEALERGDFRGCTGFCVNGFSFKPAAPGLQTGWRSGSTLLSSPVSASSTSC